jgi:hypothetical protein
VLGLFGFLSCGFKVAQQSQDEFGYILVGMPLAGLRSADQYGGDHRHLPLHGERAAVHELRRLVAAGVDGVGGDSAEHFARGLAPGEGGTDPCAF